MTGVLSLWWFPYAMCAAWIFNLYCLAGACGDLAGAWGDRSFRASALFFVLQLAAFALMVTSIAYQKA